MKNAERVLEEIAAHQRAGLVGRSSAERAVRGGPDFLMDRVRFSQQERVVWELLVLNNGSRAMVADRLGVEQSVVLAHEQTMEDKLRAYYWAMADASAPAVDEREGI